MTKPSRTPSSARCNGLSIRCAGHRRRPAVFSAARALAALSNRRASQQRLHALAEHEFSARAGGGAICPLAGRRTVRAADIPRMARGERRKVADRVPTTASWRFSAAAQLVESAGRGCASHLSCCPLASCRDALDWRETGVKQQEPQETAGNRDSLNYEPGFGVEFNVRRT